MVQRWGRVVSIDEHALGTPRQFSSLKGGAEKQALEYSLQKRQSASTIPKCLSCGQEFVDGDSLIHHLCTDDDCRKDYSREGWTQVVGSRNISVLRGSLVSVAASSGAGFSVFAVSLTGGRTFLFGPATRTKCEQWINENTQDQDSE